MPFRIGVCLSLQALIFSQRATLVHLLLVGASLRPLFTRRLGLHVGLGDYVHWAKFLSYNNSPSALYLSYRRGEGLKGTFGQVF